VLGAAAGLGAALLDVASTVLWLSTHADQLRLVAVLLLLGGSAGALLGALVGAVAGGGPRALVRDVGRVALLVAAPLALVAWLLFTGGRARRMPGLIVLRPLVWAALTAMTSLSLALAGRVVAALRRRAAGARAAGALALVVAAQVLHAVDHRFLPRLYEYLHAGLGALTALALAGAFALLAPARSARHGMLVLAAAGVGLPLGWHLLGRWDNVRAEVFGVHAPFVRHVVVALESARTAPDPASPADLAARRARYARERATREAPGLALPRAPGAHVLLVTVDALRADRLGRRAGGASLTPTLDALSARGVVFERAYAQAPHSSYSITSLHTSEYLHETVPLGQRQPLPTLADTLGTRGYHTAALYTNGIFFTEGERLTVYRDRHLGFRRADHVDRRADAQAQAAMREIDDVVRRGEPPSLLWVHFFDTHEPYASTGPTPEARYDGAVRAVDDALARVLAHARRALARDLVVAVTADHGEEFGEHGGVYHGSTLYEEQVRVPLVLAAPGLAPARVAAPVELLDLAPTLLGLVDVVPPPSMRGRDLRPLALRGAPAEGSGPVFAAVNTRTMVVRWPHKLVADLRFGVSELYDLARDPFERTNLAGAEAAPVAALRGELAAWIDVLGQSAAERREIARGLLGDRAAIPALAALARDDAAPRSLRLEAIDILASFGDLAAVAPLAALLADPCPAIADRAAAALGTVGDARARDRLRDAVVRDEPETRARAALALARLGDLGAVPALVELFHTGDEPARLAAVDALGALRARDALEVLLDALTDDHLRYRAVLALGRLADPATFACLERLAREDRADDVRANAAAALGITGAREMVPFLASLARDDGAQQYAASALGVLGAIGREVEGWDARSPVGDGWSACGRAEDGPVWRYLDARACAAEGTARVVLRVRGAGRARVMVVRARGAGPLGIEVAGREVARLPAGEGWHQWRVPLPAGTFAEGDNTLTLRALGRFELGHLVLL
jgi:arylsulfatase A-like enzyme